jgi:thymidylate synthase ThyX
MYAAKIIADSVPIGGGPRLTTIEATMPRIVLAEFNTHRVLTRNSASSRAIPVEKRIEHVLSNPFVPAAFAANKRGMQAGEQLDETLNEIARHHWLAARDAAVERARVLAGLGVHKQWANRLIEPFAWTTVLATATEWDNFFNLRISSLAQPEIRTTAELMWKARAESKPKILLEEEWHLPYVEEQEIMGASSIDHTDWAYLLQLSTARCARLSYLTQDGVRDAAKDTALHDKLATDRHMSPFEHQAQNLPGVLVPSNLAHPWLQYRKTIEGEAIAPREEATWASFTEATL